MVRGSASALVLASLPPLPGCATERPPVDSDLRYAAAGSPAGEPARGACPGEGGA